ncbi:MAG: zinc ribbon domain-containing protein [Deltaproteobacteria bacterium]|nr:zinc ribbon domain-containing protein [Deltaproteobacteria bacterium]
MHPCPRCGRTNPVGTAFCAGCGQPLASAPGAAARPDARTSPPRPGARGVEGSAARAPVPIAPSGPSRGLVLALGIIGFVALAAGTGFKIVIKPGRVLPPVDLKLRAAQPTTKAEPDEGDDDGDKPRGTKAPTGARAPTGAKAPTGARAPTGVKAPTGAKAPTGLKAPTGPTKATPPKPPEKKEPELGPPPSQAEIRGCIDKRKGRIKACANRAAENMEFVGGGTAKATMNPDGKFTRIYVPGGGTFASCTAGVIRGLTCRKYKGDPIPITYPVR